MSKRLDYYKESTDAVKAFGAAHTYLASCGLGAELVDLVYLRVSQINGCAYCIDMHSRDLIKLGVKPEKLLLAPAWRESGAVFSTRERAALAWTETVTNIQPNAVPDEAYEAALQVFSEKELSDITVAVALMSAFNRLGISFRKQPAGA